MTNNNHEVIFAIVNAGFAEDVMESPGSWASGAARS